jgi:hypothetical protein
MINTSVDQRNRRGRPAPLKRLLEPPEPPRGPDQRRRRLSSSNARLRIFGVGIAKRIRTYDAVFKSTLPKLKRYQRYA